MTRVFLLRPGSAPGRDAFATEHLGLASVAAGLRREGHEVVIHDMTLTPGGERAAFNRLASTKPELIGSTATDFPMLETSMRLLEEARDRGIFAPWIMGGFLPTFHSRSILERYELLDGIVIGEGDLTAPAIANRAADVRSWEETPGLAYRFDGRLRFTGMGRPITDLNLLPFPARDNLDALIEQGGFPTVAASRGCPYQCSFCQVRPFYQRSGNTATRYREPDHVLDEVENIQRKRPVPFISFVDDLFLGPGRPGRERAKRFAERKVLRGLDFRFGIETRPDCIDDETIGLLVDAGLRVVSLGIESGNDGMLQFLGKGFKVAQALQAVGTLNKYALALSAGFILYGPHSSLTEVETDRDFIWQLPFAVINPHPLGILEGTRLAERVTDKRFWPDRLEYSYRITDPELERFAGWFERYSHSTASLAKEAAKLILRLGATLGDDVCKRRKTLGLLNELTLDFKVLQRRAIDAGLRWARSRDAGFPEDILTILSAEAVAVAGAYKQFTT